MKLTILGGNGLVGKKLVSLLRDAGHDATPASRSSGVDMLTGAGLAEAFAGASVVVDVSNSPSFEDQAVLDFFTKTGHNISIAERAAGVGHHVALSVVGTDRLPASGYFRAKLAQEKLIEQSGIPYTIVRATQFFEFVGAIADSATDGQTVRVPPAMMQPIASADVAAVLARIATEPPRNSTLDIAGPDRIRMDDLVREYLTATNDSRTITTDPTTGYFGTPVDDTSLVPIGDHQKTPQEFSQWLRR